MKSIASVALVVLLAGCQGGAASPPPPPNRIAPAAVGRAPLSGGPGTTTLTYYDTHADVGPCENNKLTIMNGFAPANDLSFPAGEGPPLTVSLCNFTTPQYVQVTLEKPKYGDPFIRQTDYTVTVDAPGPAKVTAIFTACGPTLPCDPGLKAKVTFTIGPPSPGPL